MKYIFVYKDLLAIHDLEERLLGSYCNNIYYEGSHTIMLSSGDVCIIRKKLITDNSIEIDLIDYNDLPEYKRLGKVNGILLDFDVDDLRIKDYTILSNMLYDNLFCIGMVNIYKYEITWK